MNLKERENQAERALKWLHEECEAVGQDAAAVDYLDEFCKIELARLKRLFVGMSNAAAEDEARVHPDYLEAVKARRDAKARHESNRLKKAAAEGYLAYFQTSSSNARANV